MLHPNGAGSCRSIPTALLDLKQSGRARGTTQQSHHHQTSKNAPTIQSYTPQKGMYQCGVSA